MNNQITDESVEGQISFEKAEFSDDEYSSGTCEICNKELQKEYYSVNTKSVCESCKTELETSLNSGSRTSRLFKSLLYGVPTAMLCSLIYYGISAVTGYEFGLVAIVIGVMVGKAVRAGSNAKGGWVYQTIAVVLTYIAIASTYIPPTIQALNAQGAFSQEATTQTMSKPGSNEAPTTHDETTSTNESNPASMTGDEEETPSLAMFIFSLLMFLGLLLALPILAGLDNAIGIIIIGIGLYEAWHVNKRISIEISGPFLLQDNEC